MSTLRETGQVIVETSSAGTGAVYQAPLTSFGLDAAEWAGATPVVVGQRTSAGLFKAPTVTPTIASGNLVITHASAHVSGDVYTVLLQKQVNMVAGAAPA